MSNKYQNQKTNNNSIINSSKCESKSSLIEVNTKNKYNSNSKLTAVTNKTISNYNNKVLSSSNVNSQGTGLWCYNNKKDVNNSKLNFNLSKISESKLDNPNDLKNRDNIEYEKELENYLLLPKLKEQNKKLIEDYQKILITIKELEFTNKQLIDKVQSQDTMLNKTLSDNTLLNEKVSYYELTLSNLNCTLNEGKCEIIKLRELYTKETKKVSSYKEELDKILNLQQEKLSFISKEIDNKQISIDNLKKYNEELIKENSSLKKHCEDLEIKKDKFNESNNKQEEKIIYTENKYKETVNELLELKQKNAVENESKSKLNMIIKNKNDKIEQLKNEVKSFKILIEQYSSEIKWNQDLVVQKDSQINVYKEKIKNIEFDLSNATKAYTNLKNKLIKYKDLKKSVRNNEDSKINTINYNNKNIINNNNSNIKDNCNNTDNDDFRSFLKDEALEKVEAKPYLFGPDDNDF